MHLHVWHIIWSLIAVGASYLVFRLTSRLHLVFRIALATLTFLTFRWLAFDHNDWVIFRPLSWPWYFLGLLVMAVVIYGVVSFGLLARLGTLALVLIALLVGTWWIPGGGTTTAHKPATTTTTVQAITTTSIPQRKPAECIGGHNVVLDKNKGDKVISDGLAGLTTPAKQAKILKVMAHDPRVLMLYWNMVPAGKAHPVKQFEELMAGGCYNQLGIDRYQQINGILMNADWKPDTVPTEATNTGVTPGGQPFQVKTARGITGNRKGTLVTILDASGMPVLQFWVLDRCGNIAAKGTIPNIPPKPPVHHPTTTTTTVEHGKDATHSHLNNPSVPPVVHGCTGTGSTPSGTAPCPGNTGGAYNPDDDTSADPGPTGCGHPGHSGTTCPTLPPPTTTTIAGHTVETVPGNDGTTPVTTQVGPPAG